MVLLINANFTFEHRARGTVTAQCTAHFRLRCSMRTRACVCAINNCLLVFLGKQRAYAMTLAA
jgi:hypothetical protein